MGFGLTLTLRKVAVRCRARGEQRGGGYMGKVGATGGAGGAKGCAKGGVLRAELSSREVYTGLHRGALH